MAANGVTTKALNQRMRLDQQETLPPHKYYENRYDSMQSLRQNTCENGIYSSFIPNLLDLGAFRARHESITTGHQLEDVEYAIRGRIVTIRSAGERLRFYEVQAGEDKIQVVCQATEQDDVEAYKQQHEHLTRGDQIGVIGHPGRTAPRNRPVGELSLFAHKVILLAPSLHMLPKTLTDAETRHRNRPLDFITNRRSRDMLRTWDAMEAYITTFLRSRGYISVVTPILCQQAGGAAAKPFITHHNDLKRDMYLRTATELHLKPLVVGGIDRVFEIGRVFRNEDMDLTHNPEFTSCEFYQADADYEVMMQLTEEMISGLVKEVTGSYVTRFKSQTGDEREINWEGPWERIDMIPALEAACAVSFPPPSELHTEDSRQFLLGILSDRDIACSPPHTNARLLDKLVGVYIESRIKNPTYIIHHPKLMSPLAKTHRAIPGLTERAEAFVCGQEICNLYSELNDPFEQRERFLEQARQRAQGDDEAQGIDEEFIKALEYGMPPTAGCGPGLDRILMFLTNNYSIKEVLAFPMMREEMKRSGGGPANAQIDQAVEKAERVRALRAQMAALEAEIAGLSIDNLE
ncbi:hypothetical protein J4E93_002358 [Alternaria ventricosa]|uniref:uncharacterized protein n=1 Tax=Alternaria ventricosa TaxID=1187951 RepID=UPI0020C2443C|nr:uncharacterized protein J4E93_002358 [Alternaria ventricosa]KAI4652161.1 hypothetical protein J4E93_002358 [Alternaria ventricosa]